ncbi:MAG: dienelactone hydrolase family protein [Pseudomonadota bacterium]|nr:dienelactone hydrolase family protein [Pseudomonadota bacterium]
MSRREFTALSIAAGVAAATNAANATAAEMIDTDVEVSTADGLCEAALIHPRKGSWPGIILFTDVFGLRPTMRDIARRLAAGGFTVLVPNPFYRTTKAPGLSTGLDFNNPRERAKIDHLRAPLTTDAVMRDSTAYVKFLDSHRSMNAKANIGVVGYCMGGAMTLLAAAANRDRIVAGASLHGGGLVTDKPDSPHLLVRNIKAQYYFGVAMNDDQRQPDAKHKLAEAFAQARLPAKIEVYDGCRHGWCVKDMPALAGKPAIYDEVQAEHAWEELLSLYRRAEF